MPVYYFDWITADGDISRDQRGVRCKDLDEAKSEALRALTEWTKDGGPVEVIEIRDRPEGDPLCFVALQQT